MAELIKNRESLAEVRAKLNAANTAFSSRAAFEAATIPTGVDLIYVIDTPAGGGPTQSSVFQLIRSELGDWVAGDGSVWRLSFGSDALQDVIEAAQAAEQSAQDALTQAGVAAGAALAAQASEQAAQDAENSLLEWAGAWATATPYKPSDIVFEGTSGSSYVCVVAHTSGTFSTDLAANRWALFAQRGSTGSGAGDMNNSDNLSGLTNKAVARSNLELNALASAALTGTKNATTVLHGDDAYRPLLASYLVTLTASGTWNKPAGYADNALVIIEMWGGGGGGGHDGGGSYRAGGGGGGGYARVELPYVSVAASCAYTIGAGGTTGVWGGGNGGNTVFAINGGWTETAYGGGGGAGGAVPSKGGGGGGRYEAGQHGDQGGGGLHNGGSGAAGDARYKAGFDGGGGGGGSGYKPQTGGSNNPVPAEAATRGGCAVEGGGGGGSCGANAGDNGPRTPGWAAGGFGGRGGWGAWGGAAEAGVTPGGGGGANGGGGIAGAGARGEIRIRIIP